MAGATVYQMELSPIAEENFMTEDFVFETPFYDKIADYVYEVDDREIEVSYLADSLSKLNKDRELVAITRSADGSIETIVFREGFREAYFAGAYAEFNKQLTLLSESLRSRSHRMTERKKYDKIAV